MFCSLFEMIFYLYSQFSGWCHYQRQEWFLELGCSSTSFCGFCSIIFGSIFCSFSCFLTGLLAKDVGENWNPKGQCFTRTLVNTNNFLKLIHLNNILLKNQPFLKSKLLSSDFIITSTENFRASSYV